METKEFILKIKLSNENEYLGKNKSVNHIKPLVSVLVITYQHANYIKECIEGILMQKTDYPFEIIIGEDESNDGTREICMQYAEKHPDKIRLILRSRKDVIYINGNPTGKFNAKATETAACGKYIAICEGDDYWIDPYKLEKQITYMENNPDCSLCCHAAHVVDDDDPASNSNVRPYNGNKEFAIDEVIQGHGGFFPTSSLACRTDLVMKMPDFTKNASFGDYPLTIFLSLHGKVYYIDEFMSVYRINVPGSWNSTMKSSRESIDFFEKEYIDILYNINKFTKLKYDALIAKTINEHKFHVECKRKDLYSREKNYSENAGSAKFQEGLNDIYSCRLLKLNIFYRVVRKYIYQACLRITYYFQKVINSGLRLMRTIAKRLMYKSDTQLIHSSGFFNEDYYLCNNPDVVLAQVNPVIHFLHYGGLEGRNPSIRFSCTYYLENNDDVRLTGINPLIHYLKFGRFEGRNIKPVQKDLIDSCSSKKYEAMNNKKENHACSNNESIYFTKLVSEKQRNEIFNMFWYGDQLAAVEKSCIQSFINHGHTLRVFSYQELELPEKAINEDASSILPKDRFFLTWDSPAAFSDIFRYKLLFEQGGWWVDTDVLCLRSDMPKCDYFWAEEQPGRICGAVLKFPKSDLLCKKLLELAQERVDNPTSWGWIGPDLLTENIIGVKLNNHLSETKLAYPIHWSETHFFWLPDKLSVVESRCSNSLFTHLWNSVFKQMGIDLKCKPPNGSFLEKIYLKYGQIIPSKPADAGLTRKSIIKYLHQGWLKEHLDLVGKDLNDLLP